MSEAYHYYFEKLVVWQDARLLVKKIYELSAFFPYRENSGLASQIQRAAVSVPSNIAEGMGRSSEKEQLRFLEIAYGSLMETLSHLFLAFDLGYISEDIIRDIRPLIDKIAVGLTALSKTIKHRKDNKS